MAPRLVDDEYQGIISSSPLVEGSPLVLLTRGAGLIRELFFKEEQDLFYFLPSLPPEFHEGRMVHIKTVKGDVISFEWSKKLLAKVMIHPQETREISSSATCFKIIQGESALSEKREKTHRKRASSIGRRKSSLPRSF
ncbi:MAG: hypothetical protein LVR00_02810 [Rhabdochlamydiaceae bacterium]